MKHVLLGLAVLLRGGLQPTDIYPKNPNIDALNYTFRIELSDTTDEILGQATVDIRFRANGITRVRLDLINERSGGRG
ncbi:uncharacterized protein METZ01_LOCUS189370, partial [marine metagenome]